MVSVCLGVSVVSCRVDEGVIACVPPPPGFGRACLDNLGYLYRFVPVSVDVVLRPGFTGVEGSRFGLRKR